MGSNNIVISSIIQYYLNPFFIRIIQDLLVADTRYDSRKENKVRGRHRVQRIMSFQAVFYQHKIHCQ